MLVELPAGADEWHAPTEALGFTESLGFRFVQPGETIALLSRMNLRPNQNMMDVGVDIFLRDGGFLAARHVAALDGAPGNELEIEGVRFEKAGDAWRLTFDGPVHALASARNADDHEFWHQSRLERLILELNFTREGEAIASDAHPDGFGQCVRAHGEIWVSGDCYEIDTAGLRDRSWESDGFSLPRARRRIEARFDGGGALSIERKWDDEGPRLTGWIREGIEPREIVSGRIETEPDGEDPWPRAVALSLVDESRGRHRITAEMVHTAPLRSTSNEVRILSCQSLANFDWGGISGHGVAEYLHRLDEEGKPLIPVDV